MKNNKLPESIFSSYQGKNHCQGIALDEERGHIYYSFTTRLVKSDLNGNIIGTVEGLVGHLGCIVFSKDDSKIYGSLEFKSDAIGKGILQKIGDNRAYEDGFYCAIFDCEKIVRENMSAESDGVMRAVYLKEVLDDYKAEVLLNGKKYTHRYGCSGIDGIAIGPMCGDKTGKDHLHICYGIYSDNERSDNDYQIILCYDMSAWWDKYARPLKQTSMHKCGPEKPLFKFFVYTGNTTYGIQNLEYDPYMNVYIAAVYKGKKSNFPNYNMFFIDADVMPKMEMHTVYNEKIRTLSLRPIGEGEDMGCTFPYGSTGIYSLGNGYYYFSENSMDEQLGEYTNAVMYKISDNKNQDKAVFTRL